MVIAKCENVSLPEKNKLVYCAVWRVEPSEDIDAFIMMLTSILSSSSWGQAVESRQWT